MASIETRTGPKGTRWKVVWYSAGRKRSKTWHTEARAIGAALTPVDIEA